MRAPLHHLSLIRPLGPPVAPAGVARRGVMVVGVAASGPGPRGRRKAVNARAPMTGPDPPVMGHRVNVAKVPAT